MQNPARVASSLALKVAAVLLLSTLAACSITTGDNTFDAQDTTADDSEFSMLDSAGIARIMQSKSVRLDMRTGAVVKADVGLQESSTAPDLAAPDGEKLQLSIRGSEGRLTAATDRVRFTTTTSMPTMDIVYYFLTAEDRESYFQLLRDGVEDYGIDGEAVESWIDGTVANPEGADSYALAPGSKLGFDVVYDLRYDGTNDTQVIIVEVSAIS
ncbi:MAG: hypothetical protein ABIS84_03205 [Arachnia sp.]